MHKHSRSRSSRHSGHMLSRFLVVTAALMAVVPLSGVVLVGSLVERDKLQEELHEAINEAAISYRAGSVWSARQAWSGKTVSQTKKELLRVGKEKRAVRFQLRDLRRLAGVISNEVPRVLAERAATEAARQDFENRVLEVARMRYLRSTNEDGGITALLVSRFFRQSLGETLDDDIRSTSVSRMGSSMEAALGNINDARQIDELRLHAAAGTAGEEINALEQHLDGLQKNYLGILSVMESAMHTAARSESEIRAYKRIMAAVHADVLQMQAELARIDARVKRRIERELIEKGLRNPRPGEHAKAPEMPAMQFTWPVLGRVSAGFRDAAYKKFFGVAHEGMDIVVPQGTPVRSAADGVVFIVRDGGALGYTYVLIGHRDGYATLYGHLSSVTVASGQDVSQGQVIGLSGGTPGTQGAGPMTTAAHLHFEAIQRGVHVNPRTMLP